MIKPKGIYGVGTTCFSVVDENRQEILGKEREKRKVAVRMYYPVDKEKTQGLKKGKIFSEAKIKALQKNFFIKRMIGKISNEAEYYDNIEISTREKFPLIMYSHGYGSYMESNTFLCCELASQGYIVASVGHSYEAIELEHEEGHSILYDKSLNKKMTQPYVRGLMAQMKLIKRTKLDDEKAYQAFDQFQRKYAIFSMERVKEWAKDTMIAIEEVKIRYGAYLDRSSNVGVTGHSFGGATAYYLCQYEENISCGINIDGGLFGDYEGQVMEKPFFQICSEGNYNAETKPLLDTIAPIHLAIFKNLKHIGFTDVKFWTSSKQLVGSLNSVIMHNHLANYHVTFFNRYLKKRKNTVIDLEPKDENIHYVERSNTDSQ